MRMALSGLAAFLSVGGGACGEVVPRVGGDAGGDGGPGQVDAATVGEVAVTLERLLAEGSGPAADTPTLFIASPFRYSAACRCSGYALLSYNPRMPSPSKRRSLTSR